MAQWPSVPESQCPSVPVFRFWCPSNLGKWKNCHYQSETDTYSDTDTDTDTDSDTDTDTDIYTS